MKNQYAAEDEPTLLQQQNSVGVTLEPLKIPLSVCKVLAVMSNGKTGAPCGACRELMVQLMPTAYKDIEIMLDYEQDKVMTLGELTPEWWI